MNFPDVKALKKLADACRKAGIKSFKCAEFEFSLTDDMSSVPLRRGKTVQAPGPAQTDYSGLNDTQLSDEEKLFWSVGGLPAESSEGLS